MEKLSEIIFGSSNKKESRTISKLLKENLIKKIAPKIYTSNLFDSPSSILRRNLFYNLGRLFPNSLLSHRSAIEFKPTDDSSIFLTYKYTKNVKLGDIKVRLIKGQGPIDGDSTFFGELRVSQRERAFLENLTPDNRKATSKKNLDLSSIEKELEKIIIVYGEDGINKFRDKAKLISEKLNYNSEYKKLCNIISALLGTHQSNILKSSVAIARAFGKPYDSRRLDLFQNLFLFLNSQEFPVIAEKNKTEISFHNFAFFESYFSNYIEGTVLDVEDAKNVVKTGIPLPSQEDDSHDVLGVYLVVSERENIARTPNSFDELIELLKHRHKLILSSRKGKDPGEFKNINNRAGNTEFVSYTLVMGTLEKGYEFYKLLSNPYAKAVYMLFFISEIHPFIDGNGRIARIMMNSELAKSNQSKILIPNVFRDDYLISLKQVTKNSNFNIFLDMINKARLFSSNVYGDDIENMQTYLKKCNAFLESDEGTLKIIE